MKCDVIAEGVIKAAEQVKVTIPITVRLTGTNSDLGQKMIQDFVAKNSHIKMQVIPDFDQAASRAVELAR
jgi:succinyl-CoA synthetase beta subunit